MFSWTHHQPSSLPRNTFLVAIKFPITGVFTARQGAWSKGKGVRLQLGLFYSLLPVLYHMNVLTCRCQAKPKLQILMSRPLWLSKPGSRGYVPGSEARTEGEKRRESRTRAASCLVGEGLLGFCKADESANHCIWQGHHRLLLCLPEYK